MEDRRSPRRNLNVGVRYEDYHIPADRGGIAQYEEFDDGSVPVSGTGEWKQKPEVHACKGKEGTCKARPIKGTDYCVGHKRQQDKLNG